MARPTFKPTTAQKLTVSIAAGAGMSHEEIAIGIGISRNTLEKHFEAELSVSAIKRRLEVMQAMYAAAKKGNVTAQRAYLANAATPAAPPAPIAPPADPVPAKTPALGKKEQANVDATTVQAGTDWEALLPRIGPLQ